MDHYGGGMQPFELKINGMSCAHCVRAVRSALEKTPGVKVRDVSVGSAAGEYEPAQTSPEGLATAVRAAGYDATMVAGRT